MNKSIKIFKIITVVVSMFLMALAMFIPAILIRVESEKIRFLFIDVVGLQSLAGTIENGFASSNTSVFSFVLLAMFIALPCAAMIENKTIKVIGFSLSVVTLSYAISLVSAMVLTNKALIEVSSDQIKYPGLVIFLVGAILTLLLILADVCVSFFGEKVAKMLKGSHKSTEELLKENAELLKAGLITKEEAAKRKEAILGDLK